MKRKHKKVELKDVNGKEEKEEMKDNDEGRKRMNAGKRNERKE